MNKIEILKGIQDGKALPFHITYHERYDKIPYIRQQFRILEEEEKSRMK